MGNSFFKLHNIFGFDGPEYYFPNWFWDHWPKSGNGSHLFGFHNVFAYLPGSSSWHSLRHFPTYHSLNYRVLKAVCENDIDSLEKCLSEGWDINCQIDGEKGYTAAGIFGVVECLGLAAYLDNIEVLDFLSYKGADLNKPSEKFKHTPLMLAVANWQMRTIEYLLEQSVDPYQKDKFGFTAKDKAELRGLYNIQVLLEDYESSFAALDKTKEKDILELTGIKEYKTKLLWRPSNLYIYGYYPFSDLETNAYVTSFFGNYEYFYSDDIKHVS